MLTFSYGAAFFAGGGAVVYAWFEYAWFEYQMIFAEFAYSVVGFLGVYALLCFVRL